MLFGEPGVDPRIQPLHRFPDEWDLPWASTYHSSLVEHGDAYHEISCEGLVDHWQSTLGIIRPSMFD